MKLSEKQIEYVRKYLKEETSEIDLMNSLSEIIEDVKLKLKEDDFNSIEEYIEETIKIIKSLKLFQFKYIGETQEKLNDGWAENGFKIINGIKKYIEYDGETIYAVSEDEAWKIFLNCSGRFGCPDENDYVIAEITE